MATCKKLAEFYTLAASMKEPVIERRIPNWSDWSVVTESPTVESILKNWRVTEGYKLPSTFKVTLTEDSFKVVDENNKVLAEGYINPKTGRYFVGGVALPPECFGSLQDGLWTPVTDMQKVLSHTLDALCGGGR